ncbi:MAG: hypothetical protein ACTHP8_12775 [Bosea sp. (in: a-proteobacteria)]|uniref:hypothetical protein n=1 Tax=Bosea sp. (in: a-proteobacteria) TaxID=1871050 RepID=UPI003F7BF0E4
MMTTRMIAAAFGATLLGAAMSAAPADAAPVSAGTPLAARADSGLVQQVWHHGRPHYRPRHHYRRHWHRRRCWYAPRRVWNGWRWVVRSVRVCR